MACLTVSIEYYVECSDCGTELDTWVNDKKATIEVGPCAKCMKDARNDGYDAGIGVP